MAKAGGRRGGAPPPHIRDAPRIEDIDPPSAWTDDADCYYLWVDLPEFAKEEVSLKVDDARNINVSGKRMAKDRSKFLQFDKTFDVPGNADTDKATGKFDGEILCVTVPKQGPVGDRIKINADQRSDPNRNNFSTAMNDTGELIDLQLGRASSRRFGRVMGTLKRNMVVVFTAAVAFFVGALVSRSISGGGQSIA